MRKTLALAFVAALCTLLSACGSAAPKAVPNPVTAAALAQKSVHWVAFDDELTDHQTQVSADVTADSGVALVSWQVADNADGGTYRVMRVNRTYYVNGDSSSLREVFKLPSALATRYAGRWISTRDGVGVTFGVADGLTLPSIVRTYARAVRRTSAGANGERLPVKFDKHVSQVEEITGSFSKWNEPVHVRAPSRSTPIATLSG